jgi:hypothetical protein
MNPIEQLKSVLCDPSGKCCITGSDEDRAVVDRALQALAEQPAQYFDEVMYDGSSTAEALKRFQENVQPVDELIHAWQALEETSGHVLDEGDVEGRMHMSVIRSAWEQMDSLVRDMWEERGRK